MPLELVKAKSDELTAERDRLKVELGITERDTQPKIVLHPQAVKHFQRTMGELTGEAGLILGQSIQRSLTTVSAV